MNSIPFYRRQLFGGALAMGIPQGFVDVSDFREIADTQECWSHAESDQSIIIEILAHEDKVEDDQSAQFYFNDIAHVNDALSHVVEVGPEDCTQLLRPLLASAPVTRVPVGPPSGWLLHGKQTVAKFKEAEHNIVQVHVAVLRLPTVDTDMVLHYNQPLAIHANSSSATTAYAAPAGSAEEGAHFVRAMLQSLEVLNWDLFTPEGEGGDEAMTPPPGNYTKISPPNT